MGGEQTGRYRRSPVSRRSLLTAASASAAVGSLSVAGCLGRGRESTTVVMTGATDFEEILHTESGEPSVQQALWDAGLDEEIYVELQTVVSDSVQRMQEAQSTLQAGRAPPDIHMMDSGWTIPFILREQTTNLTEALPEDVVDRIEDDYLEAALETARHPETGDVHAVPLWPDFGMMLYRQDLIEDVGYDTSGWDAEPPSWEEFAGAVADAQADHDVEFGYTTQAAAYEGLACCTFNEVMSTWGGGYFGGTDNLFTAGDRPITVTDEPVLDAIRMMRSFIHGDGDEHALEGYPQIAPSSIVQWSEDESLNPFDGGDAVAHRNWPFAIADTGADDAFGDDLGVMSQPYAVSEDEAEHEGLGGTAASLGGWHLAISPYTDRADVALEVLEAFTREDVMLTIFELQGFLPPHLELVEEADPDEIGPIARYTDQLQLAGENAVSRPVTGVWPEQSALIFQEVHAAYRGAKTPEGGWVIWPTDSSEAKPRSASRPSRRSPMATDTDSGRTDVLTGGDDTETERDRSGNAVVNWMENLSEAAYAYLLLGPAFALLALIAFYPLVRTFVMSLRADQTRGLEPLGGFVGIDKIHLFETATGDAMAHGVTDRSERGSGAAATETG